MYTSYMCFTHHMGQDTRYIFLVPSATEALGQARLEAPITWTAVSVENNMVINSGGKLYFAKQKSLVCSD